MSRRTSLIFLVLLIPAALVSQTETQRLGTTAYVVRSIKGDFHCRDIRSDE